MMEMSIVRSPIEEYRIRQAARETAAAARERAHLHLGNAKVAVFIVAVIYSAIALGGELSIAFYVVAVAVFVALSIWHEFVMRALARARAAVTYYADGQARIEDRWMRDVASGERFRDRNHPYADDLDVFGPGSLFQLLSACRTPMGEDRLASWLLRPSPVPEIRDRQARVAALRGRIDLRERIAVVNAGRRRSISAERLIDWSEQPPSLPPLRLVVVMMALLFLAALANYMNGGAGLFLAVVPAANLSLLVWLGKRANAVAESLAASTESAALDLLANVIREIEREPFDEPVLAAFGRRVKGERGGDAASRGIARLARISDWADSRHNVFVRISEIPLLFTLQLAYAAQSWRQRYGGRLRDWIEVVGEMEALLSIAGYSFEHPADPFPEIAEDMEDEGGREGAALFDGVEIIHPLLPAATAVGNSVTLSVSSRDISVSSVASSVSSAAPLDDRSGLPEPRRRAQVLIVSGSNMSGKSTLMRTVGINALLALAGAPVRARRLRLTPLVIGTCLRHTDSLQEHRSGFYTEALRIRLICDLLDGPRPPLDYRSGRPEQSRRAVLFLFDELLSGTNSKDRRVAAEGVVRTMLSRRAIGMITTHDLALTEIAAIFPGKVRNVHLQDRVENGQMSFDYKLRDGIITHSNALELMRMIGLDV